MELLFSSFFNNNFLKIHNISITFMKKLTYFFIFNEKRINCICDSIQFRKKPIFICMRNVSKSIVQDNSGTIENEELKGFLKDLLELVKKVSVQVFAEKSCTLRKFFQNANFSCLHPSSMIFAGRLRCPGSEGL